MRKAALLLLISASAGSLGTLQADLIVLYDGTQQAVTPNSYSPQWLSFFSLGGTQMYNGANFATNFDTSASNAFQGGYSNHFGTTLVNPLFPQLDRSSGYRLSFGVEILSEQHASDQRAGFSVIAISSDVAPGVNSSIEIGFQPNRVFAQNDNPLFGDPVAQSSAFNPVGVGFVDYELTVQGGMYDLAANGQSILSGVLRDYTAFAGIPDVYEIPNFIFLGDDTTSAGANINLRTASIHTFTAVPEPSSLAVLGLMLSGAVAGRRIRGRARRSGARLPVGGQEIRKFCIARS